MSFFNRQPREIGLLRSEYYPPMQPAPDVEAHAERAHMAVKTWSQQYNEYMGDLDQPTESEVMPSEPSSQSQRHDSRPLSATGANRLDQIAELKRALTYGEMIELAAGICKAAGDRPITLETLPQILHDWSSKHGS